MTHPDMPPPPAEWVNQHGVHFWKDIMLSDLADDLGLQQTSVWLTAQNNGHHFTRVVVKGFKIIFAHPWAIVIHEFLSESAKKA